MKKLLILLGVVVLGCLLVGVSFFSNVAFSLDQQTSQGLKEAPLNPDFIKWLEDKKAGKLKMMTEDGKPLGYIPPPFKFPNVSKSSGISIVEAVALPSKFDLRTIGGVTPVRNQGNCGSCWTFATMASLESYLKFKKTETWDFSEQDLNQYHGFSVPECEGGFALMSTAYLTRWSGPVKEQDVPYPYVSATPGVPVVKHIQKVWFLPNAKNITAIKTAVYNYGVLYIAIKWDNAYYNSATYAYYYPTSSTANHAVAIVGWDDTFPKTKFKTQPPGDGAFIVKNSWGTNWGDKGYFYISYYDKTFEEAVSFFNAEPTSNYQRIYEYDPLGLSSAMGCGATTAWGANVFIASANANKIKAVGFYALVPNTKYEIYIYDNLTNKNNPRSGTLKKTLTGTIAKPGYTTVPVGDIIVTPNKRFSIVIKLTTPNYNYPIPLEKRIEGYSDAASCGIGQSFMSCDGTSWSDLCTLPDYGYRNINIKAYAVKP